MLPERVAETLLRYNMAPDGARLGVAVSGGADSVCLLHVLARLAPRFGFQLAVLHLDHDLRGEASRADQEFVRGLAAGLGLDFFSERWARPGGAGNLEQEARRARARFFAAAREQLRLDRVATGHTLSDQAETVLFRAIRGAGPGGLAGILPVTAESLIRPLMEVSRDQVRAWLHEQCIGWREDSTNADRRLARNAIRLDVLPQLESIHAGAAEALARLARLAASDERYWAAEVAGALEGVMVGSAPVVADCRRLAGLDPALGRRVVRALAARAAGSTRRLTEAHVEAVWRLAGQPQGAGRRALPGLDVWRSFHWIRFAAPGCDAPPHAGPVQLSAPGRAALPLYEIEVIEELGGCSPNAGAGPTRYNEGDAILDAGRVGFPLEFRSWSAGDRIEPVGAQREFSLKELFAAHRVPAWERAGWPVLVSRGRIVWTRRFGCACWAAAGPQTRRWLRVGPAVG